MNLIKPKKLNNGDTIGILALSGTIENKDNIFNAKKYFESKGFNVVLSENIFDENRYMAGTDEKKVEELHKFFKNPDINMILCARGGYGAIRLLDKINWKIIKHNPKIFAGYSDTSAIESMILTKTGLVTFYSPIATGDFGGENILEFTEKSFFETLTNSNAITFSPIDGKTYHAGNANGILWGGNLATIASLCGTEFIPNEKFIFFAEDLGEDTYKIDKMFTQLLNIKKFCKNIQGIILGDFLNITNTNHLDELFFELGEKIQKPILSGFKITHAPSKITLPYGAKASFDTDKKELQIDKYLKD